MLEHVPAVIGRALKSVRAGHAKLTAARLAGAGETAATAFRLTSPAFGTGELLPARFTEDAEGAATTPPLDWGAPPAGTRALVLIAEDPDAPNAVPFVHWLAWGFPPGPGSLAEGAAPPALGRNSYRQQAWLPPDPPTGHGPHDYVFQMFALDTVPELEPGAGRSEVLEAMEEHVLGIGVTSGMFERVG